MDPSCDCVALTRELIRFDTVNPPGNEQRCAEYLAGLLRAAGFEVSYRHLAEGRPNLVAELRTGGSPPLLFTGHVDVVPLGTRAWTRDPFAADEIDGRIYGRGASDMKSGVAAMVCAALDASRDSQPPNLTLVITAGEETGCAGARAVVAEGRMRPAGAIVVGEPTGNALCVGHKGALWLTATATGVAAHGSMPERGDNAIYKAARAVAALQAFDFEAAAHPMLGRPTLSVNTVHGGMNINSVPDRAEIGVDIRTTPAVDHAELQRALQRVVGDDARLEAFVDVPGVWTSPNAAWVQRVAGIVGEVTGARCTPAAATFFTDASVLTPALGRPKTIILGPGEPGQAHQTDEWCRVDRIRAAADIYARIMRDWAAAPAG